MAKQDHRVHHHRPRILFGLWPRQRRNIWRAMIAVHDKATKEGRSAAWASHMVLMVVNCILTESRAHNYGNVASSESYRRADYVPLSLRPVWGTKWIGSDHDSVGLFQQRTSWGSIEHRMDPMSAAHAFMSAAVGKGVDQPNREPVWLDIQSVQVSFDSSGHNYEVNTALARRIVRRYWSHDKMNLRYERLIQAARSWKFPK